MTIYIDPDYMCHVSDESGTMREFDVPDFDGKCKEYIEGFRYVPSGESWQREDGEVFCGEMIAAATDYTALRIAQLEYELADADDALKELGVIPNG